MKPIIRKIEPNTVTGKGDSLWGNSKGTFTVDRVEINYVNWVAYPTNGPTDKLHVSVSLFGPTTRPEQYTDTGIVKELNKNTRLLRVVRSMVLSALKEAKILRIPPIRLILSWSEWGMQPEGGWNFDCGGVPPPPSKGLTFQQTMVR
jgi:hypothetical protein